MSTVQRSLYNNNPQNSNTQSGLIAQLIQLLSNTGIVKTLKNVALSGSSIDDTQIGNVTPNQARFTSLTSGILNTNYPTVFNGPNGSQLIWRNGLLSLVNSGISTSTLYLDALSRIAWGTVGATPQAYVSHSQMDGSDALILSDPMPYIGDAMRNSTMSDMGLLMVNHHFFGLRRASNRVSALTSDAWSFQVLPSSAFAVSSASGSKRIELNQTSNRTAVEFDWCFVHQNRQSSEKVVLTDGETSTPLDVTTQTSKVYALRTTATDTYRVSLPTGDDDGHVKCIQYLPQTAIHETQAMSDPALLTAETVPTLQISGRFLLPPYGVLQDVLILSGFGVNVMLQFDTVTDAWTLLCNGAF